MCLTFGKYNKNRKVIKIREINSEQLEACNNLLATVKIALGMVICFFFAWIYCCRLHCRCRDRCSAHYGGMVACGWPGLCKQRNPCLSTRWHWTSSAKNYDKEHTGYLWPYTGTGTLTGWNDLCEILQYFLCVSEWNIKYLLLKRRPQGPPTY